MTTKRIQLPPWSRMLFRPARYKVAYGGRGGSKSWTFAAALLIIGAQRPIRVLCARETMQSMRDSVHRTLSDAIDRMGMGAHYTVQQATIVGKNGTEFIFAGLLHNVANIKSAEGIDVVWVEEAQTVSDDSWNTLIPTIRKDGSEIWVGFNPRLATDPTYKRFVVDPPSNATVRKVNPEDNPWFPEVLRIEMEEDKRRDYAKYLHIWMGECTTAIEGAVYGDEMAKALNEGRITRVSIDRTRAVDTFWDLGFGDSTAIWFAQALPGGTFHIVDYLEDSGKPISHYLIELQKKGYLYGTDWLPHDGVDAIIHKKLASGDRSRSIEQIMRASGRRVRIAPKLNITTGINAVRSILPNCRFDEERCGRGLDCLRMYQWGAPSKTGVERAEPLHDQYSHGCLHGESLVLTDRGLKRINSIEIGDMVWTPAGYSRVLNAGVSKFVSELHQVTAYGNSLFCTGEHKLFTQRGLVATDALRYTDRVQRGTEWNNTLNSWISKAIGSGYRDLITGKTAGRNRGRQTFTGLFGRMQMGLSRMASKFTTLTATPSTTIFQTSPLWTPRSTSGLIRCESGERASYPRPTPWRESWPQSGTPVQKELSGTVSTLKPDGKTEPCTKSLVASVASAFARLFLLAPNGAPLLVRVRRVSLVAPVPVYDLTVENHACYQANGLLVSNSDALRTMATSIKTPTIIREDSVFDGNRSYSPDAWMA